MSPLIVIIGPTASGKSAVAMEVAERMGGEILSVDSMQVYRRMDIGTAKPSSDEQTRVKHHLINLVEPTQEFTVARFVEMADRVIGERSRPVIATGGTPLYYKALFEGLFDGPAGDEELREKLRARGNEELYRRLVEVDPAAGARIHVNDTKRLVRAVEIFELTGKPISELQTEWSDPKARHEAMWFGLTWDKDALNRRINARVKMMMEAGWVEETRGLPRPLSKTAGEATGYRELLAHLDGRMSLDDAIEQIKIGTRQLARRQMKWFRRFANVKWLAGDRPAGEIADEIVASLKP